MLLLQRLLTCAREGAGRAEEQRNIQEAWRQAQWEGRVRKTAGIRCFVWMLNRASPEVAMRCTCLYKVLSDLSSCVPAVRLLAGRQALGVEMLNMLPAQALIPCVPLTCRAVWRTRRDAWLSERASGRRNRVQGRRSCAARSWMRRLTRWQKPRVRSFGRRSTARQPHVTLSSRCGWLASLAGRFQLAADCPNPALYLASKAAPMAFRLPDVG